ncbi:MAG: hypothetical protein AAF802_11760 [Planctomycetota bacterium]
MNLVSALLSGIAALFLATAAVAQSDTSKDASKAIDGIVIVGAGGTEEFGVQFDDWADRWMGTATDAKLAFTRIGSADSGSGSGSETKHREVLQELLKSQQGLETPRPFWLVLIGHGTWDGNVANFNLAGKDISAKTLAMWLRWIERPLCIINCSSSSGPFIDRLSGPNRVVVTATKSGNEQNFARFGGAIATAIRAADGDLDHDDAISVREAFIKATDEIERQYKTESRILTEHALLDDNGDKRGSDASLVRLRSSPLEPGTVDGSLAARVSIPIGDNGLRLNDEALAERDRLEAELRGLKQQELETDELRKRSLPILKKLATLYRKAANPDSPESDDS